jgi:geranylgeranyl pyrophosphate synthase
MTRGVDDQILSKWRELIDGSLADLPGLCSLERPTTKLQEACGYVLQGGGKRLRGLLTCSVWCDLTGEAARSEGCRALAPAVAIEALHAASLVHDDLPALDNDDMRRGRASCHKAYAESTAILTGDALVGAALMRVCSDSELSTDEQARVCKILGQTWWDLCLGQELDLAHGKPVLDATRGKTVRLKTGALFGAAVATGALCARVRDGLIPQFFSWGVRVGECFQALDDLDDGDRPESERASILAECAEVSNQAATLDSRLSCGVTEAVLTRIMAGAPT